MSSAPTTRTPQSPARPAPASPMGLVPIDPVRLLRRYWVALVVAVGVGAVIGLLANYVLGKLSPKWRTEVTYQVSPPMQDPNKGGPVVEDKDEMERFMLTQVRVMISDRILREALVKNAEQFKDKKIIGWGQRILDDQGEVNVGNGLAELRKIVGSSVLTGTNLLQFTVTTSSPSDSAAIAATIHDQFWSDWKQQSGNMGSENRVPIDREIARLQAELARIDAQRDKLLQNQNINDLQSVSGSAEDILIGSLTPQVSAAAEQVNRYETLIRQYEAMSAGPGGVVEFPAELRDVVERDPVVVESKQRVNALRNELRANTQLGAEHPFNKSLRRRIESSESELALTRQEQLSKLFDSELDRARRGADAARGVYKEQSEKLATATARKQDITRTLATYEQLNLDRERIAAEIDQNKQALAAIQRTTNVGGGSSRWDRLRILQPPAKPDQRAFPRLSMTLPVGVLLALGLTAGFLVARELLDQRIKGPSDLLTIPRLRLLGVIPATGVEGGPSAPPELAFKDASMGAIADAYRQVRVPLVKRMHQAGFKSLLVVAASPGAGATSAVCNIATGSAASDQRVLMIDANFRRPSLHKVFKLGEGPGLGEVLARKTTVDQAVQQTSVPNLWLLSAGAAANRGVPERLSTALMSEILAEVGGKFDLVVIDSPPATIAGDAFALANRVDCSVLVVRAKSEKRGLIARVRDQLAETHGEFLGVIVNGVEVMRTGYMRKNIEAASTYSKSA